MVHGRENMRDGCEEYGRCFGTLDDALAHINAPCFAKANCVYRLFELGREIPLEADEVERPQPSRRETVYRIKQEQKGDGQ